jgi:hypothetical protein
MPRRKERKHQINSRTDEMTDHSEKTFNKEKKYRMFAKMKSLESLKKETDLQSWNRKLESSLIRGVMAHEQF